MTRRTIIVKGHVLVLQGYGGENAHWDVLNPDEKKIGDVARYTRRFNLRRVIVQRGWIGHAYADDGSIVTRLPDRDVQSYLSTRKEVLETLVDQHFGVDAKA